MEDGYIKLYRKFYKWQWYSDINTKVLFIDLLLDANYEDSKVGFIEIKRGQVLTSYKRMQERTGLTQQQIKTSLNKLEKTQEINKQTTNKFTLITIENYNLYQEKQQTSNKQATNKQQTSNNIKEYKEEKEYKKNKNNISSIDKSISDIEKENINKEKEINEIVDYLNQRIGTKYKPTTKETKQFISGRLEEGYSVEDFKIVIDKKATEWMNTDMEKFLCPSTLFRPSNFEKYLNQKFSKKKDNFDIARELLEKCKGE